MAWQSILKADPLTWVLEADEPGARYQALKFVVSPTPSETELALARQAALQSEPARAILDNMDPQGFWGKAGGGYSPKYYSGVWSLLTLAQMGFSAADDPRIATACAYYIDHAFTKFGSIAYNGAPGGTIDCLQGNMLWSLTELGYEDPRIAPAFEWMARSVTGEGIAPLNDKKQENRYYSYKCAPNFACGANEGQPCSWGAVKILRAFGNWPPQKRTPQMQKAIQMGVDFLFGVEPITAAYPFPSYANQPNRDWWLPGFPVFYISDLLQLLEALCALGYGHDTRLQKTLDWILSKQDDQGRWPLEYTYRGKIWSNFGTRNKPNKWVTLRVLRMLKSIDTY
ncbi:MAG: hypothetical protein VB013_11360 [Anaerolineaceae bacterium]|nr:hypothetical protein [Anaerolineaceae bacterium]